MTVRRLSQGIAQLVRFAWIETVCCSFAVAIFVGLGVSGLIWSTFELPVARYDALLVLVTAVKASALRQAQEPVWASQHTRTSSQGDRQAGTTLTSLGALTITVRTPFGVSACTFGRASTSSRRASSVMSGATSRRARTLPFT